VTCRSAGTDLRGVAALARPGQGLDELAAELDGDEITGIIDWHEAGQGDALYDLATLALGHEERTSW
jgi:hypothetical protein